ncbi:MAG TPA: hypothetical protein PK149_12075 [Flavobacteriales bacterium]|nr:hypothetical protein [Flavobacteriales bacterium]
MKTEPGDLFARIVELNRTPRYHNQLDALQLPGLIMRSVARLSAS